MYIYICIAAKPAAYSGFGNSVRCPDVLMHDDAIRFHKDIVFSDSSVPDSIVGLKLTNDAGRALVVLVTD